MLRPAAPALGLCLALAFAHEGGAQLFDRTPDPAPTPPQPAPYFPFYVYRHDGPDQDRNRDRERAEDPAGRGVTNAEPAPAAPLDPAAGPRFQPARREAAPGLAAGARVPEGTPWAMLADWRAFALPAPAPGQLYVRLRGQVLLVEPATRRVVGVVAGAG